MYSAFLFTLAPPILDKSPGTTLDLAQKKPWKTPKFFFHFIIGHPEKIQLNDSKTNAT